MTAVEWMLTTDARARLTSAPDGLGAPATGTAGSPGTAGRVACRGAGCASDGVSPREQPRTINAATTMLRFFLSDILHPQVEQQVLEQLGLFFGQVAARLLTQHAEDVDGLLGQRNVGVRLP